MIPAGPIDMAARAAIPRPGYAVYAWRSRPENGRVWLTVEPLTHDEALRVLACQSRPGNCGIAELTGDTAREHAVQLRAAGYAARLRRCA